jgi:N-acetylneuraminic acid mutarotase
MNIPRNIAVATWAFFLAAAGAATSFAQAPEGTWSKAAPMSGPRSELQAVTVAGKIYAVGGNVMGTKDGKPDVIPDSGINQVYDPATDAWRNLAPVPKGANHTGIAAMNGKIYIAGGFLGRGHTQSTDKVFAYDPASDLWQELAPLSSPRGAPALIALGGKIHAIGGRILNADGAVDTHEVYDPATNKWTPAAPLPVARDHVGIAVVDGKIHVYGGRKTDAVMGKVGLHHIYDPAADKWTEAAPMPVPVSSGTFAQFAGLLIYLGGECTADDKTLNDVQAYDPRTDRWRLLAPIPVARHAQAAAVAGGRLYMIGGSTGCGAEGLLADNLVFTLR